MIPWLHVKCILWSSSRGLFSALYLSTAAAYLSTMVKGTWFILYHVLTLFRRSQDLQAHVGWLDHGRAGQCGRKHGQDSQWPCTGPTRKCQQQEKISQENWGFFFAPSNGAWLSWLDFDDDWVSVKWVQARGIFFFLHWHSCCSTTRPDSRRVNGIVPFSFFEKRSGELRFGDDKRK